jgi:O-antigen ligase
VAIITLAAFSPGYIRILLFLIMLSIIVYQHPFFGIAINLNGSYLFTYIFGLVDVENGVLISMRLILLISLIRIYHDHYLLTKTENNTNLILVFMGVLVMIFGLTYSNAVPYGVLKTLRFLSFNVILFAIPLYIRWNQARLVTLLKSIPMVGAFGGWVSLIYILYNGLDLSERITIVEHVNVVWMSRSIGLSILAIMGLWIIQKQKDQIMLFFIISIPGLITTMLLSGSRGPIIALFISLLFIAIFKQKRKKTTIVAILMSLLAIIIIVGSIAITSASSIRLLTDPTNLESDISALHRVLAWLKSVELIRDSPIFGIGTGSFIKIGNALFTWLPKNIWGYPHNIFLELTVEHGLIGLIIFVIPFIRIVFLDSGINQKEQFHDQAILIGFFLFALINAQLGGDVTRNEGVWYSVGFLAAINYALKQPVYYFQTESQTDGNSESSAMKELN